LVKAPRAIKICADLPTLGQKRLKANCAGLSGIAIVAGHTIVAEPQKMVDIEDKAGVFL